MNNSNRILIIDDDESGLKSLEEIIRSLEHEPMAFQNVDDALVKLDAEVDLIILKAKLNQTVPEVDGFQVVQQIRNNPYGKNIPIIMLIDSGSQNQRLRTLESGASDYINKPPDQAELQVRMTSLLKLKKAQDAANKANRRTYKAYLETITSLAVAAEYKDEDSIYHTKRIARYSALFARALKLSKSDVRRVGLATTLHDVGKIGVPDTIRLKKDKYTDEERKMMEQHTIIGARILSTSKSELLYAGRVVALSHHEKWDGTGYPNGLVGADIPLWGRICAVADMFDALITDRPYKEAVSYDKALEIIKEERGKHFDPKIVDLFVDNFDEMVTIHKEYSDK